MQKKGSKAISPLAFMPFANRQTEYPTPQELEQSLLTWAKAHNKERTHG